MNAGGMHVSREKKRITREESRKLSPKTRVAKVPVGRLIAIVGQLPPRRESISGTYGRRQRRLVKKTVKRLV